MKTTTHTASASYSRDIIEDIINDGSDAIIEALIKARCDFNADNILAYSTSESIVAVPKKLVTEAISLVSDKLLSTFAELYLVEKELHDTDDLMDNITIEVMKALDSNSERYFYDLLDFIQSELIEKITNKKYDTIVEQINDSVLGREDTGSFSLGKEDCDGEIYSEKDEEIQNLSYENKMMAKSLISLGFTQEQVSNICSGGFTSQIITEERLKAYAIDTFTSDGENGGQDYDDFMEDNVDLSIWEPFQDWSKKDIKREVQNMYDTLKNFFKPTLIPTASIKAEANDKKIYECNKCGAKVEDEDFECLNCEFIKEEAKDDEYRNSLTCNSCAADIDLCRCSSDKFVFDQTSDANQAIFKVSDFGTKENPIYATVNLDSVRGEMMRLEVCVLDDESKTYIEWESEVCEHEDFLSLNHVAEGEYLHISFTTRKGDVFLIQFKSQDSDKGLIVDIFKNDEEFELGYLLEEDFIQKIHCNMCGQEVEADEAGNCPNCGIYLEEEGL